MKKLLIALLTVALCMGLAACGGDKESTTAAGTTAGTTTNLSVENPNQNVTVAGDITPDVEAGTIGAIHWDAFVKFVEENPSATAEEIANAVLYLEVDGVALNQFFGAVMPVDSSFEFYTGFGEEFKMGEYKAGALFGPAMSSIAYLGYIFELEEGADTAAFIENLTANCNPRWQMCVVADQTVAGNVGNKVFFLMCPATYEMPDEAFGGEEVFDGGMALD